MGRIRPFRYPLRQYLWILPHFFYWSYLWVTSVPILPPRHPRHRSSVVHPKRKTTDLDSLPPSSATFFIGDSSEEAIYRSGFPIKDVGNDKVAETDSFFSSPPTSFIGGPSEEGEWGHGFPIRNVGNNAQEVFFQNTVFPLFSLNPYPICNPFGDKQGGI